MLSNYAYAFLEFAIVIYAVGFGWEHWNVRRLIKPAFLYAALGLALVWFTLDEIAVSMEFWGFPKGARYRCASCGSRSRNM